LNVVVRVRWTEVGVDGGVAKVDEETLSIQARGTRREYTLTRKSPLGPLGYGAYRVDVFLDGSPNPAQTLSFRFQT
jgi:hypothetical protein